MKFAFVSHVLPPMWSGQSVVISRLLEGLSPDQYCLIKRANHDALPSEGNYMPRLPAACYDLPPEFRINRGYRFGLGAMRQIFNTLVGIVARGRQIARIIRHENCEAVVACTGDLLDPPAAYLASRLAGVPFYPYYFDYYGYQFVDPGERRMAAFLEPFLIRGAKGLVAPNEILSDELRLRFGIEPTVIHNPCDISQYPTPALDEPARTTDEVKIVYTGAVSEAHFDAFINLLKAIEMIGRGDVRLHMYTALSHEYLAARGIRGHVVFHEHQDTSAIPRIQREADILFLPLAFDSPYPEIVRTSATTKLAEYLAASRPILVHAPPDSFPSRYFRDHQCGLVVDSPSPADLAQAIEQLISNKALGKELAARAWECAKNDYSVSGAQTIFARLLDLRQS